MTVQIVLKTNKQTDVANHDDVVEAGWKGVQMGEGSLILYRVVEKTKDGLQAFEYPVDSILFVKYPDE